jgi:hypothetical protein
MAKKLKDLCVKTGEYTTQDGQTKNRWMTVGSLMANDDGGEFLLLSRWFNPAGIATKEPGQDSILVSCFDPREEGAKPQQPAKGKPGRNSPF